MNQVAIDLNRKGGKKAQGNINRKAGREGKEQKNTEDIGEEKHRTKKIRTATTLNK